MIFLLTRKKEALIFGIVAAVFLIGAIVLALSGKTAGAAGAAGTATALGIAGTANRRRRKKQQQAEVARERIREARRTADAALDREAARRHVAPLKTREEVDAEINRLISGALDE